MNEEKDPLEEKENRSGSIEDVFQPASPSEKQEGRSYIAFISYRHLPLDKEAAERIQKKIESYVVPKEFRDKTGGKKLGMVFRDEDELPATSSLTGSIYYALDHSRFLIVICTPGLPLSKWCEAEIRYFLKTHDRDHILAVLTDGEPYESFSPYLLHTYDEEGRITGDTEPLAANIAGENHTINNKAFKKEIVRLYAALIGCPFDALWQRERRARTNRLLTLAGAGIAVMAVFLGVVLNRNARIEEQNRQILAQNDQITEQYNQIVEQNDLITEQNGKIEEQNQELQSQLSAALADSGLTKLKQHDLSGALSDALRAVENEDPAIYDHRAERLMTDALGAYQYNRLQTSVVYSQSTEIEGLAVTDDGRHVLITDAAGLVRCLDSESCDVQWEYESGDAKVRLYTENQEDRILVKTVDSLCCLDVNGGNLLWTYQNRESSGNYFQAVSGDGSLFAVLDRPGDSVFYSDDPFALVFLETKSGREIGRAPIVLENFKITVTTYDEVFEYGGAFSSDNSAFACVLIGEEKEQSDRLNLAFRINLEDFSVTNLFYRNSMQIIYGVETDPSDESVFVVGFSVGSGGIDTIRCTKDGEEYEFDDKTIAGDISSPGGITGWMREDFRNSCPCLFTDNKVYIFCDNSIYILDKKKNDLMRNYALSGRIVTSYWLDKENGSMELFSSDGYVINYGFDTTLDSVLNNMSGNTISQGGILLAAPVTKGLFGGTEGKCLTVSEEMPGRILCTRYITDPNCRYYDLAGKDYDHTNGLILPPWSEDGLFVTNDHEVTVFEKETGNVKSRTVYEEHLLVDDILPMEDGSLLIQNRRLYPDGKEEDYTEKIGLDTYTSAAPAHHVRLADGRILSWCDTSCDFLTYDPFVYPFEGRPYLLTVWTDGEADPASADPETALMIRYDYSTLPVFAGGRNGYILTYGIRDSLSGKQMSGSEAPAFWAYNAGDGSISSLENRYPDSGLLSLEPGTEKPLMAAAYEDGTVCIYNLETGECIPAEKEYTVGEVAAVCFAEGDEYLLVVTAAGRLDIYETADMKTVYSDTPELYKEYVLNNNLSFQKMKAAAVKDSGDLLIFTQRYGDRLALQMDTDTWTLTGTSEQVHSYDPQSGRLFGYTGSAVLSFPVYDLPSLKEMAAEEAG